jgi:hypothetical protein
MNENEQAVNIRVFLNYTKLYLFLLIHKNYGTEINLDIEMKR